MAEDLLKSLNSAQIKCVTHRPDSPLQILAGPGSGKTTVLTSRIAYMILHYGMDPSSICAVTFTNKAANEMRGRLVKLIGKDSVNKVKLGTFHAICALFLRKYGTAVGLDGNFTICDTDESKRIVTKLLKPYSDFLASKDIEVNAATLCSMISRAKSKGETPEDVMPRKGSRHSLSKATSSKSTNEDFQRVFAEIYCDYEKALRNSNSLDSDDLLLFGVRLFSQHPRYAAWCQHILVDEFQDTNAVQYELMCCIAAASRCVTVVGDPDQSIYGWRSADITNLGKMQNDFSNVSQIMLEQNYRSAGSILAASLAIISQDTSRIAKTLHTSHSLGPLPMLRSFPTEHDEAAFIAWEINRMIAQSGGMLGFGDFAVLLRFNAISRTIENALQKEGIPNRILGGHQFFERAEIKDILAYLQLVDNPHFEPAFSRAINIPARGIGDKSLREIISRAQKLGVSPLTLVERIHDSIIPDLKPSVKRKVQSFVNVIRSLRSSATDGMEPAQLIGKLVELIGYQEHLKKSQPDWDTRWENVQELINFASDATANASNIPVVDGDESTLLDTPLRQFLQASMLSSAGDQSHENDDEKVSIATCHAAKGLEWPVVFVPAGLQPPLYYFFMCVYIIMLSVEHGTFPFYRSDDIHEERRLLYVACTRAQTSLYLTHTSKRKVAGVFKPRDLSEFISKISSKCPPLFSDMPHTHSTQDLRLIAKILDRGSRMPDELEVKRRMTMLPRVKASKLTPADLTHGFVNHSVPLATFHPLTKVESAAQPAVHSRSDRPQSCAPVSTEPTVPNVAGTKRRRLGMGRSTTEYTNKKFKVPVPP
ncbi:P-loop containing nucleoside triphosphate hydrolase protein [Suillus lakei]|nr:P-loop containing nucleoside triphosphate hydrolase protein [Suillus lakei]